MGSSSTLIYTSELILCFTIDKLKYWQGKDSLKEKSYLTDEGKQKPGPQRKLRLIDEFLMVMMRLRLGLL